VAARRPEDPGARRRATRLLTFLGLVVVVAAATASGVLVASRSAVDRVARVAAVTDALSSSTDPVENFLLVGSDTRAGSDPSSPDFGGIGDTTAVQGSRSDTIMVLRRDRATGAASLLSIPRDLWVTIAGTNEQNRINSAYERGPDVLVRTVRDQLGIPVHHYVEVDFSGFKRLVDAIGGVTVCFARPARDANTGLDVPEAGCRLLGGVQALAYARSRHYEELVDGTWREDPTADLGRTKRQRAFVDIALRTAVSAVGHDPFRAGEVLAGGIAAVRVDGDLDLVATAASLRTAVNGDLVTYTLPVRGTTIKGKAVLLLGAGADQVLQYFAGQGPAPDTGGG
jgi:LCP family protein required for cell wall assembly